jgi:hypothetical protein
VQSWVSVVSTWLLYFAAVGLKFNGHANAPRPGHQCHQKKKNPTLYARRLATLLFLTSSVAANSRTRLFPPLVAVTRNAHGVSHVSCRFSNGGEKAYCPSHAVSSLAHAAAPPPEPGRILDLKAIRTKWCPASRVWQIVTAFASPLLVPF